MGLRIHIKSKQNGEIPSIREMTHVETPPDIKHEDWCDKRDQLFQKSSLIEPNRGNALSKLYHRLACHMNLTQDNFRRRMGIVLKEGAHDFYDAVLQFQARARARARKKRIKRGKPLD